MDIGTKNLYINEYYLFPVNLVDFSIKGEKFSVINSDSVPIAFEGLQQRTSDPIKVGALRYIDVQGH